MLFAAGIPLRVAGRELGFLIVMDTAERSITSDEAIALRHLAAVARDAALRLAGESIARQDPFPSGGSEGYRFKVDVSGHIVSADRQLEQRLGHGTGSLAGRRLAEILGPGETTSALDGLVAQLGAGGELTSRLRLRAADGGSVQFRTRTRLEFAQGMPSAIEFIAHDITSETVRLDALQHAEQALAAKAGQLAEFRQNLRQLHRLAIAEYDSMEDMFDDYLQTGCEILRMPVGAVLSLADDRVSIRATGGERTIENAVGNSAAVRALAERGTFAYPHEADLSDPVPSWAVSISVPIYAGQALHGVLLFCSWEHGDVRRFCDHEREILELIARDLGRSIYEARLTLDLSRQTEQDPLTGLGNRLAFVRTLERLLQESAASNRPVAAAFLDLDRFKQVNDTFGHAVGDEVLRQTASRLALEVGPEDHVARVGGDEFTILFHANASRSAVRASAQRVLEALRAPYMLQDAELFVTASMGVSFFPEDAVDAKDLLQKADAAMYRAKSQGKNDFRFFTPDIIVRGTNRLELETQLRRALDRAELRLGFQPLVTTNGLLDGLEALLSWDNPRFGRVGAARFIPIAEESGMIIPIGTWVLREVCRQVAEWRARRFAALRVAINVSMLQFARPDFVETVARALTDTGMPPECLELELTESIIMRDVESSTRRLVELREVGVRIAIDDFGTGYSSLSYLHRLPVDSLKIDRSFIGEVNAPGTSLPLIQTVVQLAHNMGLTVVAEGVENLKQLELLRSVGCDRFQGHLFGQPLTVAATEELLRRPGRDVPIVPAG